jgi:hypothetical protein
MPSTGFSLPDTAKRNLNSRRKSSLTLGFGIQHRRISNLESTCERERSASWQKIPKSLHAAAERTWRLFRDHIRNGDIGLRGELKNNPPIDIDRADCLVGEFNVFDQTLTIPGQGPKPARTYRRVLCVKDDVMKIVESISKNRPGLAQREWPPIKSKTLKPAPEGIIRDQIGSVYSDAEKNGAKVPNLEELLGPVRKRLKPLGYKTSRDRIRTIASEPQFKSRRRPVGKRLA